MNEVLETSRYDFLTGRRVDFRDIIMDFFDTVFTWLFENLGFSLPSPVGANTNLIATLFTIVAIALALIASFVLLRAYLKTRIPKRHTLADIFEEARNHTVAELIHLSNATPDRRTAIRYKYIAAILSLNENDIIIIEPSATNAIILRQIKSTSPALAAPFAQIADSFHLTWFGHKELDDEKFNSFNIAINKVISSEVV